MKVIAITQARTGSKRFPNKILKKIGDKSLLKIHLERISKCKNICKIIVATTNKNEDKLVYNKAVKWGFDSFRGSEIDVLDRFYRAVKNYKPEWIVRLTSDCPLIDPELIDDVISFVQKHNVDYGSNTLVENFPDGQDIEVFKFSVLENAWKNANLKSEREHVTPYIRNNSDFKGGKLFSAINYPIKTDYSKIRMTVDENIDLDLIRILIQDLGTEKTWYDYTDYIIKKQLNKINNKIVRNEGLLKSLKKDLI